MLSEYAPLFCIIKLLEIIASYIPLVSFLGEVVGRNTEVVLHDLADIDASVVAIVNGEVSGRTIGSPATDLVLRELEEDSGEQVPYRVRYTARAGGRTLASSSHSRATAAAGCSPGSGMPETTAHRPLSARRPSRIRPASSTTTMLTPGSHSMSCPIFCRRETMNSGVAMPRA